VPSELFELPNVVLTPHLGSATWRAREAMTRLVVDNLLAVERGDPAADAGQRSIVTSKPKSSIGQKSTATITVRIRPTVPNESK
jgi:phosphoglycerate dehydrogenase-like enzyme